jgi:hypothetical protein
VNRVRDLAAGFAAGVLIMGVAYAVTAEHPRPLEHVRCVWVVSQ